jgi:hypothetical protein
MLAFALRHPINPRDGVIGLDTLSTYRELSLTKDRFA